MAVSAFEGPKRSARQQLDASKQGSPLEGAAIIQKLRDSFLIKCPELRQNPKQRLGFAREICGIFGFTEINPRQAIAVVEQKSPVPPFINKQAAKDAV